jgi:hypothetical protein
MGQTTERRIEQSPDEKQIPRCARDDWEWRQGREFVCKRDIHRFLWARLWSWRFSLACDVLPQVAALVVADFVGVRRTPLRSRLTGDGSGGEKMAWCG